jgi:pimeloyl-ACP methyl ester carboxylesterase
MGKLVLPEMATKKNLSVNGRTYPIIEAGEGPLVLCLHGFPDNYESFHNQIEPFVAAGYRVICPMMPGFVPENRASEGNNSPVFATGEIIAMIEGLLQTSGEEKCHLVGHDWGALIAYMVAEQRPDLLSCLTVLSIPYNVSIPRILLRCPSYLAPGWYVTFFQLKGLADWVVKRNNWKFLDMLYRTWCPTWKDYDDRLVSVKETFNQPGVLTATLSYYRNSIFGLNSASFKFRRWYSGKIEVPTLGIRGEVDGCMTEVAWDLMSPKSFPKGITLERMPQIGHFPQLENPQWVSERLIAWFMQHSV